MTSFALALSISVEERLERMRSNILRWGALPRLADKPPDLRYWGLACYGPSLLATWEALRNKAIISVSGAHDFLIERGLVPTYHVECDPRPHKAAFLRNPHPDITYCIASCCHPTIFEQLEGHKVLLWHLAEEPVEDMRVLLRELDIGSKLVGGGSTVGLRAIVVADVLGVRDMDIYGMDCSYNEGAEWAGTHSGEAHVGRFKNRVAGRVFETSTTMYNAAKDFFFTFEGTKLRGCSYSLHGDGMLNAIVQEVAAGRADKKDMFLDPVDATILMVDVPDEELKAA